MCPNTLQETPDEVANLRKKKYPRGFIATDGRLASENGVQICSCDSTMCKIVATDMVERRAEVFARLSTLKEEASILTDIFADKVSTENVLHRLVPAIGRCFEDANSASLLRIMSCSSAQTPGVVITVQIASAHFCENVMEQGHMDSYEYWSYSRVLLSRIFENMPRLSCFYSQVGKVFTISVRNFRNWLGISRNTKTAVSETMPGPEYVTPAGFKKRAIFVQNGNSLSILRILTRKFVQVLAMTVNYRTLGHVSREAVRRSGSRCGYLFSLSVPNAHLCQLSRHWPLTQKLAVSFKIHTWNCIVLLFAMAKRIAAQINASMMLLSHSQHHKVGVRCGSTVRNGACGNA